LRCPQVGKPVRPLPMDRRGAQIKRVAVAAQREQIPSQVPRFAGRNARCGCHRLLDTR
jgi:hypothetical protein